MNINSLIPFLLALSHANAARVRNTNSSSSQTSRARPSPTSPPLSPCQECRNGFRISTCVEIVQNGNNDNATGPSVGVEMNSTVACLLYTEGRNYERLTSTCTCNAITDSTDGNLQDRADTSTYKGGGGDTLAMTAIYLAFPCFILLMWIICCVRNRARVSSAVRPEEEPDSNDARKQRECVLAILFPPSGGKDACPSSTTTLQKQKRPPMGRSDDLESQEDRSGNTDHDVAIACSICLEKLGSKSSDKEDVVSGPCSHLYHRECILSWLQERGHDGCPYCRQPMWDTHEFEAVKASLVSV